MESVEGEIFKTDPTRHSVPPGHPMVDQQGQFTKGSPNRDHRCGVLPVHIQQYSGLGCQLEGSNCIWHLVPRPIPTTHQCPGASSHMGRPVRICVPSDKPDKGLSKQGQNRKRRYRPDSASLAQPGVVSGPTRYLNRLSNNSPTSAETAQKDLLTPLSSASVASQPSRLEVIKRFHKEIGFSEAVSQRLAISQR